MPQRKPPPPLFHEGALSEAAFSLAAEALLDVYPPGEVERTSFRLSPAAADALDWLSAHLRDTQRALFDRAADYLDAALRALPASELRPLLDALQGSDGERKTFLISRHALDRLNAHADRLRLARDALASFALLGMRVLLEERAASARDRRAACVADLRRLYGEAEGLMRRLGDALDDGDPVLRRYDEVLSRLHLLVRDLEEEQRTGEPLPAR